MRTPATSRPTTGLRRPAVRLAEVRRVLVAEHARHPEEAIVPGTRTAPAGRRAPKLAAVRSALAGRPGSPRGAR